MSANDINGFNVLGIIAVLSSVVFYAWKRFWFNELGYVFEKDALRIESLGGPWKLRIPFEQIESVEVVPAGVSSFLKRLSIAFFSYSDVSRLTGSRVIIKRNGPVMFKYVIFTPKDPAVFIEKLRQRVKEDYLRVEYLEIGGD